MQTGIVIVCITAALLYAVWFVYRTFQRANDPCATCEGCALKGVKHRNRDCPDKKPNKKFGGTKKR